MTDANRHSQSISSCTLYTSYHYILIVTSIHLLMLTSVYHSILRYSQYTRILQYIGVLQSTTVYWGTHSIPQYVGVLQSTTVYWIAQVYRGTSIYMYQSTLECQGTPIMGYSSIPGYSSSCQVLQ